MVKPKTIEYYEGGEEHDFIENDCMNEKLEIFTDFLLRAGIDFKVQHLADASGKFVTLEDNGVICIFNKAGRTHFEHDVEVEEQEKE